MTELVVQERFNPNPITKLACTILLSFTVLHPIPDDMLWGVIVWIALMFMLNGYVKDGVKSVLWFAVLFYMPSFEALARLPALIKMFMALLFVVRMFYVPFLAGKYLIKTSDVGTILSSLDKLKVPSALSIPVAVMFRFFPAFREERNNIKLAMKVRGITWKRPLRYMECVVVPLLILSSTIAEDIAKAAETKCIENPIKKSRYRKVGISIADALYASVILALVIGGWIW